MCMLSIITPEADVNYEHLLNGARQNTDGYGFAMVTHKGAGGLIVERSMNRWELIEKFREARTAYPGKYAMFHSRWGTAGVRDVTNCHPFQVGNDPLTVLAHNGVFAGLSPTDPADPRSDTAVFAEEIMPKRYRRLDRIGVQQQLMSAIGTYNKVGILSANPRYLDDAYLFNQPAGIWVEGVWHSNSDYKGGYRYRSAYLADTWDDDDWTVYESPKSGKTFRWRRTMSLCPICGADLTETLDITSGECVDCGFCVDCQTFMRDCSCTTVFDPKRFLPVTTATTTGTAVDGAAARKRAADAARAVTQARTERLALPAGSGSSTRYGDGFDGEDDTICREPENYDDCEFHPVTNYCMSRACPYVHKLPEGEVASVEDVLADFDAAVDAGFDDAIEGVVMGPTSLVVTPAGDTPSVYVSG
jgi:hypothetical protein